MVSRYDKYLKKRDEEQLAADDAEKKSNDYGSYADLGASLINKFQDGQQGETQFAPNTIANLGQKHIATEQYKAPDVDAAPVKTIWANEAKAAKDKVAKTDDRFNKETAMNETKKKEDQDDANSDDSRKARIAYKAALMKEADVARKAGNSEAAQRLMDSYDDTTSANQAYKNISALKSGSYEDLMKIKDGENGRDQEMKKQDKQISAQYGLSAQNNAFQVERDKTKFGYDKEIEGLKVEKEAKKNAIELEKPSEQFKQLPKDKQETIIELAKANSKKESIANQIDAMLVEGKKAKTPDAKLAIYRQMGKILNSTEGADAVGSDERKNLLSKLDFAMGNFTNNNSIQFGRDLDGFVEQAAATSSAVRNAKSANQKIIDQAYGREAAPFVAPASTEAPKKKNSWSAGK